MWCQPGVSVVALVPTVALLLVAIVIGLFMLADDLLRH